MMTVFESMWDSKLDFISVAKHGFELTSDELRPVHSASYRAGPETSEFEKQEICKMVKLGVIQLTEKKWTAPIVLAPRRSDSYAFVSIEES